MLKLGDIFLPEDLQWIDEFDWNPLLQQQDYTLTGALIVQNGIRQGGRPITLEHETVWVTREVVESLSDMAGSGQSYALTLPDNQVFTVRFAQDGLKAAPVQFLSAQADSDPYTIQLRLISV